MYIISTQGRLVCRPSLAISDKTYRSFALLDLTNGRSNRNRTCISDVTGRYFGSFGCSTIKLSNDVPAFGWPILARQKGLGPLTCRLGGGCSIQLSYWRIFFEDGVVSTVRMHASLCDFRFTRVGRTQLFQRGIEPHLLFSGHMIYTSFDFL